MDEDDIEGQEDETIRFDGDIALTPFNLKDELEEGDSYVQISEWNRESGLSLQAKVSSFCLY